MKLKFPKVSTGTYRILWRHLSLGRIDRVKSKWNLRLEVHTDVNDGNLAMRYDLTVNKELHSLRQCKEEAEQILSSMGVMS